MMVLFLYAVVGADHPLPDRTGVHGAELATVRSEGLAAVVSRDDSDGTLTDRDAVDHLDVITALSQDGPVVPFRFGTIAPDADAVRHEVIASSRELFDHHLAATADVVELLATVEFDEDAAVREIISRPGSDAPRGDRGSLDHRIELGEWVVERLGTVAHEWADELLRGVVSQAESVVTLPARQPAAARYALLVRRDRLADLDAEMKRVPDSEVVPCHIEYVGPLPPVDFPPDAPAADNASRWGW